MSSRSESVDDTLIPVRMLNEFTYCPRLGYLEWVQGEWAENIETLEGTFGHRNVDQPDRKQFSAGDADSGVGVSPAQVAPANESSTEASSESMGASVSSELPSADNPTSPGYGFKRPELEQIHARSLTLSAPVEGILAKLDLLELDGTSATPVDYKRGKLPDVPEGAYEPERVQLCAQGLILRANGYEAREGILYFIESRRRVVIPFTDALIARTLELVVQFRNTANAGRLPPPLDDSPKCPRCSLVGICLPDETNLILKGLEVSGEWLVKEGSDQPEESPPSVDQPSTINHQPPPSVRRLIPARHDALPLYLQDYGLSLGKSGERMVVKQKGEEIKSVALKDVSQVCLFGNIYVTEPAIRDLASRGVPICHFSYGGWFYALTSGLVHKNVELRIQQFEFAAQPARSLELARQFIIGKIKNCRTLLRRHLPDDEATKTARDKLLWQLNEYIDKARATNSVESILGIEGTAARLYFSGLKQLLKGDGSFDIEGRNRRPPKDRINALLSFLYSLLTKVLTVTLQAVGFDPMLGFMHQPRYGKPALALDLAEEFRPLIADSTVLSLVNNREVQASDFITRAGAVALTDVGRRAVMGAYERRMNSEITHPIFGYKISYRRTLEVQARLLARTVLGELPEYPSFLTR
ncbi:MAG: CRISPR-associated endonuclease Cas1 [Planctomycetota bacterium]|nr:MAG: CRISPR-associated endonuclease Cas1 [Planctomycetota bacterium]